MRYVMSNILSNKTLKQKAKPNAKKKTYDAKIENFVTLSIRVFSSDRDWAESVSSRMNTIAPRDQFIP